MKLREELQKDTCNKNRVFNIYTCDCCSIEYKKQKRLSEGSTQEHYCSLKCFSARPNNPDRTTLVCAHCGIFFSRANSKLLNSRSGLYFCCREHKDLGQKIHKRNTTSPLRNRRTKRLQKKSTKSL